MTSPLVPLASNDLLSRPWIVTRNRFSVTRERESAAFAGHQATELRRSRARAPCRQVSRCLTVFKKRSGITVEFRWPRESRQPERIRLDEGHAIAAHLQRLVRRRLSGSDDRRHLPSYGHAVNVPFLISRCALPLLTFRRDPALRLLRIYAKALGFSLRVTPND